MVIATSTHNRMVRVNYGKSVGPDVISEVKLMNSKTALFSGLLATILGGVTVEYIRQDYLSSDNGGREVIEQQIRREIELEQEIKKEKEARRRREIELEQKIKKEKEARRRAESEMKKTDSTRTSYGVGLREPSWTEKRLSEILGKRRMKSSKGCIEWLEEILSRGDIDHLRLDIRPRYIPRDVWSKCDYYDNLRRAAKAKQILDSLGH